MRFYNAVIDEFLKQGIRPILNLHHFDLPVELYEKYGGWESKHVVDLFTIFAKRCFELFGDRVKDWVTFNEPMVVVEGEYLYEFHYPKLVDGKKACQVPTTSTSPRRKPSRYSMRPTARSSAAASASC